MAHNVIRRQRIVDAFRRALQLGGDRREACHSVGQALGLDTQTVEWCVGEAEAETREATKETSDGNHDPR